MKKVRERHIMYNLLYMWNFKKLNIETESNGDFQGLRGNRKMLVMGCELPIIR